MRIAILLFVLLPILSISQTNNEISWGWSGTYGNGTNDNIANHLVLDDTSNLYVAGVFRGELAIQSDTIWGNPNEDRVFISKFDSLGNLIWLRKIDWGYYVNQIRLDANNDVRVLCNAGIMIVYNGGTGVPITYYPVPHSISDYNSTTPFGITIDFQMDEFDNMYFLQRFEDMNTWWTSSYVSVYASPNDTISNLVWEDSVNVGIFGFAGPTGFSLDSSNNVYVTGVTDYAILSQVGTDIVTTNTNGIELFAIKYNALGEAVWLQTTATQFAWAEAIEVNTVDSSLYLTGYTVVDEDFFGDSLFMDTTKNQQQIFLSKFDLDGNHAWSQSYPLHTKTLKTYTNASWGALGSELQIADSGYVYLKGSFTGSIIFNADTLYEDTSSVILGTIADDVFIAKLDPHGNPIWGKYAGNSGGSGLETGDFYVDPSQDIVYYVGYWASPNNLNKMATPTNNPKYIFLGKEGDSSTVSVSEIAIDDVSLLIYPNPSEGTFFVSKPPKTGSLDYFIRDFKGSVILDGTMTTNKAIIDLSDFPTGVYFFQAEYGAVKLIKN